MKNNCSKWKDLLLEAALTEIVAPELRDHLSECPGCVEQLALLRVRRQQLDAALPLLASKKEPSPDFAARVLAAAEAQHARKNLHGQRWLFVAAAVIVVALIAGVVLRRSTVQKPQDTNLAMAEKLARWHSPTDALLATPGQEILRKVPNLGESYLRFPVSMNNKEE